MQRAVAISADPAATLEPPKPRAKSKRNTIVLVLAIAVAIGGVVLYVLRHGRESTDDAQIDADVVLVPARVDGVVKKVLFSENQRVKAGDVLAEIDDAQLVARLAQAEAQLARAVAAADAADANAAIAERNAVGNKSAAKAAQAGAAVGERTEAAQLLEGQAQLSAAEAQLGQAKTDLERQRRLQTAGAGTKAELDQAETQLRLAQSNVDLAKARIGTLQTSIAAARSRVDEATARAAQNDDVTATVRQAHAQADAAKADVKVATALRDLAALNLGYAKIIAPQDGVISKKSINVGQQVGAGQAIGQLVTDARWVTANFKETQVEHMREGQPATVSVDAFSGEDLRGTVESISSGTGSRFTLLPPDNASGNFTKVVQRVPVRIKLGDVPRQYVLRTGMNVDATVDTRGSK
ncbi:MAG TPA: HlyD family secretion protein [Kofleriaceae bacterium]|nr:HlyD family secretion protein [Kofleriaceae bacterium]